jgi:excisionase family DNA binding protein
VERGEEQEVVMEKLLLRPHEAAEVLGLGRSKVYEMIASGAIPSITIGKSRRVPLEALRAWVRAQAAAAEPEPVGIPAAAARTADRYGRNVGGG